MSRKMLIDGEGGNPAEEQYDFDLFVIGAGSGGVRASRTSAGYGAKVGEKRKKNWGYRIWRSSAVRFYYSSGCAIFFTFPATIFLVDSEWQMMYFALFRQKLVK